MTSYWKMPAEVHGSPHVAHDEDSLAIAEHLDWGHFVDKLAVYEGRELRPSHLLERAWLRVEYALATPDTEHDAELFEGAEADVSTIVDNEALTTRSKIKMGAALLGSYMDIFKLRAEREYVGLSQQNKLQSSIGELLIRYMEDDGLHKDDYGILSELITPYGLLYAGHLPFLASPREEGNVYRDDNHNFYTIHPCGTYLAKKVPISVKHAVDYAERDGAYNRAPGEALPVAVVKVGRVALEVVLSTPPYNGDNKYFSNANALRHATRLAADVMACHASGETLDEPDQRLLTRISLGILEPVITFANSRATPDYPLQYGVIESHLAAIELRNNAHS